MNTSPENPSTQKLSTEERIGNCIDSFGNSIERIGNCFIKHVEYQIKRDTCHLLADKTKIGLLLSLMVSSWLTVALLLFIVLTLFPAPLFFPIHPRPEVRQAAPPPVERPYEIHHPMEARNVA